MEILTSNFPESEWEITDALNLCVKIYLFSAWGSFPVCDVQPRTTGDRENSTVLNLSFPATWWLILISVFWIIPLYRQHISVLIKLLCSVWLGNKLSRTLHLAISFSVPSLSCLLFYLFKCFHYRECPMATPAL